MRKKESPDKKKTLPEVIIMGEKDCPYMKNYPPEVIYFSGDRPLQLEAMKRSSSKLKSAEKLPFICPPQKVKWNGSGYNLDNEGRYCFMKGCKLIRQIIVYKNDIMALFRSLAQIQVHGNRHCDLSQEEKIEVALKGHLSITCGYISRFAINILDSINIKARAASLLTLDEWNAYNNGHSLFEFYDPEFKRWILVDIDVHALFLFNGKLLNLFEFHRAVVENKNYEIIKLTSLGTVDPLGFRVDDYEASILVEHMYCYEDLLRQWYCRVAQKPGFINPKDGKKYFPADNAKEAKRLKSYNEHIRTVSTAKWVEMFYG